MFRQCKTTTCMATVIMCCRRPIYTYRSHTNNNYAESITISTVHTLSLNIDNATTIDLKQAQHVCNNITDINEGEGSCVIDLDFKPKIGSLVCFVAYIEYEENSRYSYTILDIEVTKQLMWVLLLTALPPAVILLVIILFVCLILCIIQFCCCKQNTRYTPVNLS